MTLVSGPDQRGLWIGFGVKDGMAYMHLGRVRVSSSYPVASGLSGSAVSASPA